MFCREILATGAEDPDARRVSDGVYVKVKEANLSVQIGSCISLASNPGQAGLIEAIDLRDPCMGGCMCAKAAGVRCGGGNGRPYLGLGSPDLGGCLSTEPLKRRKQKAISGT